MPAPAPPRRVASGSGTPSADDRLRLDHLGRLMGPHGLYEHAIFREPRRSHGYTVDDNARVLVVLAGEDDPAADPIFRAALGFVLAGHTPVGWRNRMSPSGEWMDHPGSEDAHGRAIWGLGVAAEAGRLPQEGVDALEKGARRPLTAPRAVAYAILGLAAACDTSGIDCRPPLARHASQLPMPRSGDWMWPEERLAYANARIPQAMMSAGVALEEEWLVETGVELLTWLVGVEWRHDRFSFTPVAGRGPGEHGPAFDQQPIEAWAMADACALAARLTGEDSWWDEAAAAVAWFHGRNDGDRLLFDVATGATFDGLEEGGVNANCGAESTLAGLGATLVERALGRRGAAQET